MALVMIKDVESEVIDVDDAKTWLRVDHDDDDDLIAMLLVAARRMAQRFTRRAIGEQQWRLTLDAFPEDGGAIELPLPPLVSVDGVQYVDTSGETVAMEEGVDYIVDTSSCPGRIVLPSSRGGWPATKSTPGAVIIEYTCGTEPSDDQKVAILQQLAIMYENRQAVPEMLLRSDRVPRF